jgi:hypothetical protein
MVGVGKEVAISIAPDGTVHVDVKGVKGKSCVDLVKFLEESLGEPSERKFKPDYYDRDGYITDAAQTETKL